MFEPWEAYYIVVGGVAGALIGLMFVVATLAAGFESREVGAGAPIFLAPIVFHFTIVVIVSAIAEVPELPSTIAAVFLALIAGVGFAYAALTTVRVLHWEPTPDWSDKWFYGVLPAVAYLGLAAAAATVWVAPEAAPYCAAAATLAVLLIGIRNAWDLAIAFVLRARRG